VHQEHGEPDRKRRKDLHQFSSLSVHPSPTNKKNVQPRGGRPAPLKKK
jgi:hypothetical protein